MFDQFWSSVTENSSVHLDALLFEWLGYENVKKYNIKAKFIELLKSHSIEFRQIKHSDPDFKKYPELVKEASTMTVAALKQRIKLP